MKEMRQLIELAACQPNLQGGVSLYLSPDQNQPFLLQDLVEQLINGIVIFTEQGEVLYNNDYALQILRKIRRDATCENLFSQEIWHVCQFLIQSRNLFPEQYWSLDSEISINTTTLYIRAQWLKMNLAESCCLLVTLKDQHCSIRDVVLKEAQKYGLTSREREIWALYRTGYTYKQIAVELNITPNTVKKHMKSIHAKQKAAFGEQDLN